VTARRRLVPTAEVEQHIELLRRLGVLIGAIDIRADGVTVYPPTQQPGNDYDNWKRQEPSDDRPSRRQ
jgi:hypothetical protein